jgi:two-component system KDP operon response regulator KdpE
MIMSILLIEDDPEMLYLLQHELESNGFPVITAANGLEGLRTFHQYQPGLCIIDVGLPIMDGRTLCQRIREVSTVPILMMTGKPVTEKDIAQALDMGADEYVLKPLRLVEFVARVRALLRRSRLTGMAEPQARIGYSDPYLSVDLSSRIVRVRGEEIRLTPTEFKLLSIFIRNPGTILTFQQLLEQVWGAEYIREHHYPRIYVSHLRRKIEPDAKDPTYIQNEYGIGYRFHTRQQAKT